MRLLAKQAYLGKQASKQKQRQKQKIGRKLIEKSQSRNVPFCKKNNKIE